ncbi:MAG: apolipoprotein N-acyltransferase [Candidatus Marinimicrobia bacterium]|nr:apolipoprotein N-acyltransferase [Candidatus Neomarinimicrobiota bacterium]
MKLQQFPDWVLALISGVLFGITFLPFPLGFLNYFSLVPLLIIWLNRDIKTSAAMTYIAAITANTIAFYWIGLNKGTSMLIAFTSLAGAVFYLGLFWLIVGVGVSFIQKRLRVGLLLFPFLWVTMEYLRSFGPMGFPWSDLALTQVFLLPMVQTADVTGSAGIAFFICILNGLFYLAVTEKEPKKYIIGAFVLWGIVFGMGSWRLRAIEKNSAESQFYVAVIQPNVDPVQKWEKSYKKTLVALMDSLTDDAMNMKPDFVLWPEAALPAYLRISYRYREPIRQKVIKNGIPLLAGTIDMESDENGRHYYNGAILFNTDGSMDMYHKLFLVPFAEYIPLSGIFPSLKKLNIGWGNFDHGNDYTIFKVGDKRFGNMICYESSFPRIARRFMERGAEFLTIETNDAWSGDAPGAYQHFGLAQLRAVENRVPVVRSANTGISGIIAPSGRVLQKMEFGEQGILFAALPFVYSDWDTVDGDLFALMCIFIGLGIVIWEWIKTRKMRIGKR